MKRLCFIALFSLTACTYNVSMSHVSGSATDTMDDAQTTTPTVSPNISIPVKPL